MYNILINLVIRIQKCFLTHTSSFFIRIKLRDRYVGEYLQTDTASVLMEAIGYIKFLQNQVETLSVPYMKPAHKNSMVPTQGVSVEGGNEDAKRDLRSRGLCLIPLSCLSYVTDGGGGVWPAP
ncbi:putative transcription factor bHLH family [Helianthus annuus]|nr:putative transcription factor bHLH family [Helianthus annuus]